MLVVCTIWILSVTALRARERTREIAQLESSGNVHNGPVLQAHVDTCVFEPALARRRTAEKKTPWYFRSREHSAGAS